MILFFHLFIGAVIAAKIGFLPLVIVFALLSHYFLDFLPHNEYSIKNIKGRNWKNSKLDFLKLFLDLTTGIFSVFFIQYISKVNYYVIFAGAIASVFPDILTVLNFIFPNNIILKYHIYLHGKIHIFSKYSLKPSQNYKKIPLWGYFLSQISVVLIGLLVLLKRF